MKSQLLLTALFSLLLIHCEGLFSSDNSPLDHTITLGESLPNGEQIKVAYLDSNTNQITHSKTLSRKGDCLQMSALTLSQIIIFITSDEKENELCNNTNPNHSLRCGSDRHYEIKPIKKNYGSGWSIEPSSTPSTNTQCEPFTLEGK